MALILIADDDALILDLVADALRQRGHVVGTLEDGRHVIDIVNFKRPALVILDCGMPTMSGIDVLRQIRASQSSFDTPVLMLTGRRSEADEEIAMRAGANEYMRKPFIVSKLVDCAECLILEAESRPQAASM